jgi:hypothetical protein
VVQRVVDGRRVTVAPGLAQVAEPAIAWRGAELVVAFVGLGPTAGWPRVETRTVPGLR